MSLPVTLSVCKKTKAMSSRKSILTSKWPSRLFGSVNANLLTPVPAFRMSLVVVSDLLKVWCANLPHQLAAPPFVASWPPRFKITILEALCWSR